MSESHWAKATRTWLDRGWIEEAHRAEVQAWLDEHHPPAEPSPFLDVALMALVIVGNWLLVGACSLATGLLIPGFGDGPPLVALVASFLQLAAGLVARMIGARALAQGFLSAWVVVVVVSSSILLDLPWKGIALVNLAVVLFPVALALGAAFFDRMPGLGASAGMAAAFVLIAEASTLSSPGPDLLFALMCVLSVLSIGVARLLPERGEALLAAVPFWTGTALWAITFHRSWVSAKVLSTAWAWECGGVGTALGLLLLAGAALTRSRATLLSGMAALIYSELVLLVAMGNFWLGVGVLGLEGALLIGGAVAALVFRTVGAQREAEPA